MSDAIHFFMTRAYDLALRAQEQGEVPVGAVVVLDHQIIGEGWNSSIQLSDPSAHAEILALRDAAKKIHNYRLIEADLFVTLEPCLMCASAMIHARIRRLFFGAYDLKTGAAGSRLNVFQLPWMNHTVEVTGSVMETSCVQLLKEFFVEKRK